MQVVRLETTTPSAVSDGLAALAGSPQVRSVLALLAAQEVPEARAWEGVAAGIDLPVIGGVFPRVIDGDALRGDGGVLLGLPVAMDVAVVGDLGDREGAREQLDRALVGVRRDATVLTIMDAAADHIDALLEMVYDRLGPFATYIGGGAGSLRQVPEACVLTSQGMLAGGAAVAVLDAPAQVGVAHGWEPLGPSLRVTRAGRRRVIELDHRPAAEVYVEVLRDHAGLDVAPAGIADIAASYPLGLVGLDDEMVVRDPLGTDGSDLLCIAEIPQWAFVRMLHGDPQELIAAAGRAAAAARSGSGGTHGLGLVFDCISRVLHLGDLFGEELARIEVGSNRFGAATIGEVCNPGDRFLELYNKTVVAVTIQLPPGAAGE